MNKKTENKKENSKKKEKGIVQECENNGIQKKDIYYEFIVWSGLPPTERLKLGIETQEDFCNVHKIHRNTLTKWKKLSDFKERVEKIRRDWAFEKTSDIIYGIYRSSIKGNPASQKLWLQYFANFEETTKVKQRIKVEVTEEDIRNLINVLPRERQQHYYGELANLADEAEYYGNSQQAENVIGDGKRGGTNEIFKGEIQGEADNLPQEISGRGITDEMATGDKKHLRTIMAQQDHTGDYQSAERRWEEQAPWNDRI